MLTLEAQKRDTKTNLATLRKEGKVPAVFYGRKEKSTPVVVSGVDFAKIWHKAGESTVIGLTHEGKEHVALIHEVQLDPLRETPIHIDFYVVEADKVVEVHVPLEFIGVSPAVKDLGGTLVKVLHELEVSGLPKDLPSKIEVDISSLDTLESQITVENLTLPAHIKPLVDQEEIVAAISVTKEEEEAPAEAFDAAKIEVEKKGKEEEADEEGAESKKEE